MGVTRGSSDPILEFRYPLHISGTVEAKNFKFGTHIDHAVHYRKNAKLGQKGSRDGHVTYF